MARMSAERQINFRSEVLIVNLSKDFVVTLNRSVTIKRLAVAKKK